MKFYIKTEMPLSLNEESGELSINVEIIPNCRSCVYSKKNHNDVMEATWRCNHAYIQDMLVVPEKMINCEYYQKEKLNPKSYK